MKKSTAFAVEAGTALLVTVVAVTLLLSIGIQSASAVETASVRYVATSGSDTGNTCLSVATPCASLQRAIDVADAGDEIRVGAGTYSAITDRDGLRQVAYISKTVQLRGGFSTADGFSVQALALNTTTIDAGLQGRGIYVTGTAAPLIEGLAVVRGSAFGLLGAGSRNAGGGIYLGGSGATISATRLASNQAFPPSPAFPSYGGGIYSLGGSVAIHNSTLLTNSALQGGALYAQGGQVTIVGTAILSNWANFGAGIGGQQVTMTLSGSRVTDNLAQFNGGGLYGIDMALLVTASHFLTNSANTTGAGIFQSNGRVTIQRSRFIHNRAYGGAGVGALHLDSTEALVEDTELFDNFSETGNSALSVTGRDVTVNRTLFRKNSGIEGGVIGVSLGTLTATNVALIDNDDFEAAILLQQSSARINQVTIVNTRSRQGQPVRAIFTEFLQQSPFTISLSNLIVMSHSTGIEVAPGVGASLAGVLWFANGTNQTGIAPVSVISETTGNPRFAADGYHLTAPSPAINRGVATQVTTDIDGATRSGTPDLGADEYGVGYGDPGRIAIPMVVHRLGSGW